MEDERLNGTDLTVTARTGSTTQRRLTQTTITGKIPEVKCSCGKICKNLRGLKIHQAKTKCGREEAQVQRTDLVSGETSENPNQEAPHSVGVFLAPQSAALPRNTSPDRPPQSEPMKERIKWPKMSDTKAWATLDQDLNQILEVTTTGTVERKINTLTEITYNLAKERFGTVERKHQGNEANKQKRERNSKSEEGDEEPKQEIQSE